MEGWKTVRLGDLLAVLRNGVSVKQNKSSAGQRISRIESIASGLFDEQRVGYAELSPAEKEKFRLCQGDILFSHINSPKHVGKTAVFASGAEVYHGMNLLLMRPSPQLSSAYLEFYLRHLFESGFWRKRCKQSVNQASVNQGDVRQVPVPLPPLPEQKRIVAILDEAFAAIATATANTERNLANARELFENYRDDVLKGTGQGWRRCSLQEVCYRFEYGSSAKSQRTGEVPVLRMGNIQDGEIDFGDLVYSSDAQEMDRYRLKPGDVLFNRTNSAEHVGKTAIYRGGTEALFAGYLVRVNPVPDEVEPGYLNHYLNGRASREYGKSVMSQSVHQANISAGKLREYPFAFPDMDEQRKLVDGLDRMKAETAQVVVLCGKKLARLAELKQSILHQAFTGQLTAGPRQLELDLA